ncbi:MAG: bifunctional metallophosphatase/5'-nucleotidase [Deltaproteobacteria bacterium]|nr:bifunctional metallophosphatase/5'-nucleotidase [Deltaproteobacteria bacterium]
MKLPRRLLLLVLVAALGASGCVGWSGPDAELPEEADLDRSAARADTARLTLLYTADEHGWLRPTSNSNATEGGAAELLSRLKKKEGYEKDAGTVLLSGGDMWTGPAISTWFKGESTAEVMNAMGYRAAALGNHEFDFGRSVLETRRAASDFPFLAANVVRADGGPLGFAEPYTILEADGVKIGLVGLALKETPQVTQATAVAGLSFGDYAPALRTYVPEVRSRGAQVVIVLAHVCLKDLEKLAAEVADLELPVMFGAHCHETGARKVGNTWLVAPGSFFKRYARVTLSVERASGRVTKAAATTIANSSIKLPSFISWLAPPTVPDADVKAIVDGWQTKTEAELGKVIGYTRTGLTRTAQLPNLVTDAWRWAYPQAELALSNTGALRQDVNAGDITLAELVGLMPFDNTLYDLRLTGAQVLENLSCCGGVATSGLRLDHGRAILTSTGQELDATHTYRVLVNSFMYGGGDGFRFKRQDPAGYDTTIDWRQPVIDWVVAQGSSAANPLEAKVDATPRK